MSVTSLLLDNFKFPKGGDFMGLPIEGAPAIMVWEGGPLKPGFTRDQRVGEGNNIRHPERVMIEAPEPKLLGTIQFQQARP